MKERTKLALKVEAVLISICLALVALWLLCSCTTTKVVTVEKVKTDTTYITKQQRDSIWLHITKQQRDSIWLHDSIFVSQQQRGDTILLTTTKWHTKYIEREVHDTLYRAKTDSIPVPYEVVKEVHAELSWWQKTRIIIGTFVLGLLAVVAVYRFGKWHLNKIKP